MSSVVLLLKMIPFARLYLARQEPNCPPHYGNSIVFICSVQAIFGLSNRTRQHSRRLDVKLDAPLYFQVVEPGWSTVGAVGVGAELIPDLMEKSSVAQGDQSNVAF